MCSVRIVELHFNVQHTTILSAARKCLNDEFLSPEERRTYGSLHAKRQTFLSHFNQISIYTRDYHRNANSQFHANPSSGSSTDMLGRTDMVKPIRDFPDYAKTP